VISSSRERINKLWLAQHCGKVTFRSRWHAWLVIACMCLRDRRMDWYLHPYECRWAPRIYGREPQRTGDPHIHIGHGRNAPWLRLGRKLKRWFVYPYYRTRRELKIRLGLAQRPPRKED
jgi:hypothetical protein